MLLCSYFTLSLFSLNLTSECFCLSTEVGCIELQVVKDRSSNRKRSQKLGILIKSVLFLIKRHHNFWFNIGIVLKL